MARRVSVSLSPDLAYASRSTGLGRLRSGWGDAERAAPRLRWVIGAVDMGVLSRNARPAQTGH